MITAFVINMDGDMERFERVKAAFSGVSGFEVRRSPGVKGSALPDVAADMLAQAPNYQSIGLGVLGVFLAHVSAWERVKESATEYALVLEDDVVVEAPHRLNEAAIPKDADIIFCNDRMQPRESASRMEAALQFLDIDHALKGLVARQSNSVGGDGYLLSRSAATKLLARLETDWFFGHVDWRLLRYAVTPELLSASIAGTQVADILTNHHLHARPPAWGLLRSYTLSRPIVRHHGSQSRRNSEDIRGRAKNTNDTSYTE